MKKHLLITASLLLSVIFQALGSNPKLIYPADRSMFNTCTDRKVFSVNANDSLARIVYIKVLRNDPRELLYSYTKALTPQTSIQAVEIQTYPDKYFLEAGQYLIEVKTADANLKIIGLRYFTIFAVGSTNGIKPRFAYPTAGATEVSLTPTVKLQPYTSCGNVGQVIYFLDRHPADWKGDDLQTDTLLGQAYEWKVPKPLQPNTEYDVAAVFITGYFFPSQQTGSVSFTTATAPAGGDPILVSPAPNSSSITICGRYIGITVNPNHPDARTVGVKVLLNDPRTFVIGGGGSLTPQEATRNVTLALSNALRPLQQYLIEVTTFDAQGSLLKQKYFTIFTPSRGSSFPELVYPANQSMNVSLTPTIALKPFPTDACGTLSEVVYELWSGAEAQRAEFTSPVYQWTPPKTLLPNTIYQLRVTFRGVGITPIGPDVSTSISFTTGVPAGNRMGAGDLAADEKTTIHPNPFVRFTTIHLPPSYGQASVRMYSVNGQMVFEQQSTGGSAVYLGEGLRSGLYLVLIRNATGHKEQFKIIKQE
jgi:hypothetical protein